MGDWQLNHEGRWVYDENAPSVTSTPEPTSMLPTVAPLEALHGDDDGFDEAGATYGETEHGDVGDWIDPNAPDPTPDEIVDPGHPDYVAPWRPA